MTVSEIIDRFGTPAEFGRAVGLKIETHGALMRRRNSIPPVYWPKIIKVSKDRGFPIALEDLLSANPGASDLAVEAIFGEGVEPVEEAAS